MTDWDQRYEGKADFYGDSYPRFVDFIDTWKTRGEALDLGCGQGRDSLYLARVGYQVTSVDGSAAAIAQLLDRASGLALRGVVSDVRRYVFDRPYDLVMLDMVLHFLDNPKDTTALLKRIYGSITKGGLLCAVTPDQHGPDADTLRDHVRSSDPVSWRVLHDDPITHELDGESFQFHMIIAERV
jgi:SAM-dependent methyltransferase